MSNSVPLGDFPINNLFKMVIFFVEIIVRFSRSTYRVNEDAGPVSPVLVLSNPSSTDITIQIRDTQITATSE